MDAVAARARRPHRRQAAVAARRTWRLSRRIAEVEGRRCVLQTTFVLQPILIEGFDTSTTSSRLLPPGWPIDGNNAAA